jgi:hypothetical protein
MPIKLEYLPEPKLQFGEYFEHEDSKTGLAEFGPFGKNVSGLHPGEIKIGFVGTRQTVAAAQEWIESLSHKIESDKKSVERFQELALISSNEDTDDPEGGSLVTYSKVLHRDFCGFGAETPFASSFVLNDRWNRFIKNSEIDDILSLRDKVERINQLVTLFESYVQTIAHAPPKPDIILIALTPEITKRAHSVQVSNSFYLNFRRSLKAKAMRHDIPLQLIQQSTSTGTGKPSMQDRATRAWNFATAQYYKADGVPWRPVGLEEDVCFIGISFYTAEETRGSHIMRASVAQAFDYLGQGLVVRGDDFKWDSSREGRTPHLTTVDACNLIERTLKEYEKRRGIPPRRIVIHKTTEFWGDKHSGYDELSGFREGIAGVYGNCATDFVALRQSQIRLFREGRYPPLRGTYFCLENTEHFLYTVGYIPYLETSPSAYVPSPWHIAQHDGESDPKQLLREVLALTKMNVNNCSYADGTPITISFAKGIGEIMKHVPQGERIQSAYKFYM